MHVSYLADLADVLRLHILFKHKLRQLCAGHALQQPAGLIVLCHPLVLPDLSNRGPAPQHRLVSVVSADSQGGHLDQGISR